MLKNWLNRTWPVFATAAMLAASFAPLNWAFLIFVAFAPWLASLKDSTVKGSFRSGFALGFLFWCVQLFWLGHFIGKWSEYYWFGLIPVLLGASFAALLFGLFAILVRQLWRLNLILLFPLIYAGVEVFFSYMPFLAFPWSLLGVPLVEAPWMVQHAYFGTVYLVSAWATLPSVAAALFLTGENFRKFWQPILIFFILLVVSLVRFGTPIVGERKVITVGQPGVDMAFGDLSQQDALIQQNVELILDRAEMQGADLVILPEGLTYGMDYIPPPTQFRIDPFGIPILFGGQRGTPIAYQSAYAVENGEWSWADKTRLVIFGEYVPFRDQLEFLQGFNLPAGDLKAADQVTSIDIAGMRVGPVICFEALFPDISWRQAMNGSNLLAIMSIDDWYVGTGAPQILRQASTMRAIENGLPMVRSATLGYSFAVDQRGRMITEAPFGEVVALRAEVTVPEIGSERSPWKPIFPIICLASLLGLILHGLFLRFRPT
ncbi:MAG: apolipoprotein N-acyltransferase [Fimbriimonadaceae bacterium]